MWPKLQHLSLANTAKVSDHDLKYISGCQVWTKSLRSVMSVIVVVLNNNYIHDQSTMLKTLYPGIYSSQNIHTFLYIRVKWAVLFFIVSAKLYACYQICRLNTYINPLLTEKALTSAHFPLPEAYISRLSVKHSTLLKLLPTGTIIMLLSELTVFLQSIMQGPYSQWLLQGYQYWNKGRVWLSDTAKNSGHILLYSCDRGFSTAHCTAAPPWTSLNSKHQHSTWRDIFQAAQTVSKS